MHVDPPEHDRRSYSVEASYRCDETVTSELPGVSIRFAVTVAEDNTEDLSERRHTIEFSDGPGTPPRGWIRHSMKRVEAQSGRFFWTESRFEVEAPELPHGQARQAEVEREVQSFVDKIRLLDRSCHLVEI